MISEEKNMLESRDDHFSLFTKPKLHEIRAGVGSENTGLYKKYVPTPRNLDFVVEYFAFEERKRRGFSSPYLTKNPYENAFADYVDELENKYSDLPSSVAHNRLIADLEAKHTLALASLK
jgi:hypothetical protein